MSLAENKKARLDYFILETLEAGIELSGPETKSARAGHVSLNGAYVSLVAGEAFLLGARISPYQPNNPSASFDPERSRRLLLKKSQLKELADKHKNESLTIVPLSMYNKGVWIKLSIGLARGKKKYDKRETLKKRDSEREIRRTLKRK